MSTALGALAPLLQEVPIIVKPIYVGIYFLFDGNEVVYVGQSTDVPARVYAHQSRRDHRKKRLRMKWDRALWIAVDEADLDAYEGALIRRLTPRYNTGAPRDTSRDQEICDRLALPPPDLIRLAEWRERRNQSFKIPGRRRSEWLREHKKRKARFEKKFGFWIEDVFVRYRKIQCRHLWNAVRPILDSISAERAS